MTAVFGNALVLSDEIIYECSNGEKRIHRVNTRHTVFKILYKGGGIELDFLIIPVGNEKARQYKKHAYTDMKFTQKTPYDMWEIGIEYVTEVRDEHKIGGHGTNPG